MSNTTAPAPTLISAASWTAYGAANLDDAPRTAGDAMAASRLDWTATLRPLVTHVPRGEFGLTVKVPVPGHFAVVRDDDAAPLAVVGNRYQIVQNAEVFGAVDPLVQSGRLSITAAGEYKGGRRIWLLCEINGANAEISDGDKVQRYLLLTNTHDGSGAVRGVLTDIRPACGNQIRSMLAKAGREGQRGLSIRHTSSAQEQLAAFTSALEAAGEDFRSCVQRYRDLARAGVSQGRATDYFARLAMPAGVEDPQDMSRNQRTRADNLVSELLTNYRSAPGASPGSAWGCYQAATYHVDHQRGANKSAEARAEAGLNGSGAKLRERAFQLAVAMADGSTVYMDAPEADASGVDSSQVGRALLDDLLS